MRIGLLTREFPPDVYGGAGVHVEYLVRELRRWPRSTCTASASRGPAPTAHEVPHTLGWPAQPRAADPRGRPGVRRRASVGATSSTRTPGTPTWAATSPSCSTTSRTSSPRTPSSPAGRGRPSSSAVATRSPRGPSGRRTRAPTRSSRSARACAPTSSTATRPSTPTRSRSSSTGSTPRSTPPTPRPTSSRRLGVDLSRPYALFVGRITRQKGLNHLVARRAPLRPRRADRAVRRVAGHPRDRRGDRRQPYGPLREARGDGVHLGAGDGAQAAGHPAAHPRGRVRVPLGLRAARHRQPRGDGLRARRSWPATSVASRRSSRTAETGLLVHYDPADPDGFEAEHRRRRQRRLLRPGARRGLRCRRPRAGGRRLRLGRDRPPDPRGLRSLM